MKRILRTSNIPTIIVRLVVGIIFLSEGIQKFLFPDSVGEARFVKAGFANADFWSPFTACFEISCALLLLLGFLTRVAVVPLLIVMFTAFVTTKWPIFIEEGFWPFAHESRTDFAMTLLLLFLLIYGGGKYSVDKRIA